MQPPARVYAADWVAPVVRAPIAGGAVVVSDGRVAWVGQQTDLPDDWSTVSVEYRRGILTPGLVNAHTHLQYTRLAEVGKRQFSSFEEWCYAFESAYRAVVEPSFWSESAREGAQQGISSGTTVFAETITNDEARGALAAAGVTGIEYLEVIGETAVEWDDARGNFLSRLATATTTPVGVSPHAPYSLDGAVIEDLARIAADRGLRLHSHVAESAMEAALYCCGNPAVLQIYADRAKFDLIRRGGVGKKTAAYVDGLGVLSETAHLAHAIYFDRSERDLLRTRGTQVALCPRSNASLGVGPAPVAAYLNEAHEISVGTDSLASSPSLDMVAELAALFKIARDQGYRDTDLADRLLRAGTFGGARAMGLDRHGYGTLTAGGPADLAVFDVPLDGRGVADALIADGKGRCTLTVAGGAVLYDAAQGAA